MKKLILFIIFMFLLSSVIATENYIKIFEKDANVNSIINVEIELNINEKFRGFDIKIPLPFDLVTNTLTIDSSNEIDYNIDNINNNLHISVISKNKRTESMIKYGRLYNWQTVYNSEHIIDGFRVPSVDDWEEFISYLLNENPETNINNVGILIISDRYGPPGTTIYEPKWTYHSPYMIGDLELNKYNWHGLAGGYRYYGPMQGIWQVLYHPLKRYWSAYWTTCETEPLWDNPQSYYYQIRYRIWQYESLQNRGFSVRLLRNTTENEFEIEDGQIIGIVNDADDNIYETVKIGNQIWTVQNLATTTLLNGINIVNNKTTNGSYEYPEYYNFDDDINNVFFKTDSVLRIPLDSVIRLSFDVIPKNVGSYEITPIFSRVYNGWDDVEHNSIGGVFIITDDSDETIGLKGELTLKPNDERYGDVRGEGVFKIGDEVKIAAYPERGYRFLNWESDGRVVFRNQFQSFIIKEDMDLVANFRPTIYLRFINWIQRNNE